VPDVALIDALRSRMDSEVHVDFPLRCAGVTGAAVFFNGMEKCVFGLMDGCTAFTKVFPMHIYTHKYLCARIDGM
jgi:hypothetical protein